MRLNRILAIAAAFGLLRFSAPVLAQDPPPPLSLASTLEVVKPEWHLGEPVEFSTLSTARAVPALTSWTLVLLAFRIAVIVGVRLRFLTPTSAGRAAILCRREMSARDCRPTTVSEY